jgi:hypothetical protein
LGKTYRGLLPWQDEPSNVLRFVSIDIATVVKLPVCDNVFKYAMFAAPVAHPMHNVMLCYTKQYSEECLLLGCYAVWLFKNRRFGGI